MALVLKTAWHDRNQYGKAIQELIDKQQKTYDLSRDTKLRLKITQSIAYLIQTQNSLIASHEKRLQAHEPSLIAELSRENRDLRDKQRTREIISNNPDYNAKHQAEIEAFQNLTPDEQVAYHKKLQEDHKRNTDAKKTEYNQLNDLVWFQMKKTELDKACLSLEKDLGKKGKVLIDKFKAELTDLIELKELLLNERAELKEQLALLTERRLEYEDIIKSVNKEIPKNVYLWATIKWIGHHNFEADFQIYKRKRNEGKGSVKKSLP